MITYAGIYEEELCSFRTRQSIIGMRSFRIRGQGVWFGIFLRVASKNCVCQKNLGVAMLVPVLRKGTVGEVPPAQIPSESGGDLRFERGVQPS